MYEGQIMVDILNEETGGITRAIKRFNLPFQPYKGMNIDTGLGSYTIDTIEWSLEHMTYCAQVYLVMSDNSLDYANEFEITDWEMSTFQPVEGYRDNFIKEHRSAISEIIECDFCKGTGEGGIKQSMLGPTQSVCNRCAGLGEIKQSCKAP
jgi:hypothetical protein